MVAPDRNPPSEPFSRAIPAGSAGKSPKAEGRHPLIASYLALPKRTQFLFGVSLFITGLAGLYISDKMEAVIRGKEAGKQSETPQ